MKFFRVNASEFKPGEVVNPTQYQGTEGLGSLLTNVVTTIAMVAGVLLLGFFIYGGITWLTAQGNEDQVEKAQKILSNAVIGLVIVAVAFFLTEIIGTILGFGNIFNIEIPGP